MANSSSLHFRGTLSERDWMYIQVRILSLEFPTWLRWTIGLLLKGVAIGCLYWMIEHGGSFYLAWGFLLGMGASLGLMFLPLSVWGKAQRHYRENRESFRETSATLSEAGISLENDQQKWSHEWQSVAFVVDRRQGLLFCQQDLTCVLFLPARILDDVSRNETLRLLEAVGMRFR